MQRLAAGHSRVTQFTSMQPHRVFAHLHFQHYFKYNGNSELLSLIISTSLILYFYSCLLLSFLPPLPYNQRGAGEGGRKEKGGVHSKSSSGKPCIQGSTSSWDPESMSQCSQQKGKCHLVQPFCTCCYFFTAEEIR